MTSISDFSATAIDGTDTDLSQYADKVVLVVNTASQCGFTSQYKGLQQLHETYADQGLVVLGFPCDQFGGQEPGTEDEISDFCERNFGVTFPLFAKVDVYGDDFNGGFVQGQITFDKRFSAPAGYHWGQPTRWFGAGLTAIRGIGNQKVEFTYDAGDGTAGVTTLDFVGSLLEQCNIP